MMIRMTGKNIQLLRENLDVHAKPRAHTYF